MINMMIPWLAVQFGINYTRKVCNFTQLRLVKLQTLLVQLTPNCTASHVITYTNVTLEDTTPNRSMHSGISSYVTNKHQLLNENVSNFYTWEL